MTNRDKRNFCGFLEYEQKENSGVFIRKLFRLDTDAGRLEHFTDNESRKFGYETKPDGSFNVYDMAMAADASFMRPKVQHCFYIVMCGQNYFLKADSEKEKLTWISKLQDASRIQVPERRSFVDSATVHQTGCKVEVIGGVILKTPMETTEGLVDDNSSSDESTKDRSASPYQQHVDEEAIKSGYGVKQGVFRKSWKNRFFVLSKSGLRYYKTAEDKIPIKLIKLSDIMEARISIGIHLNREYMVEVVTAARVFYIQVNSASERDAWIHTIKQCSQDVLGPKHVDVEIQTDSYSPPLYNDSSVSRSLLEVVSSSAARSSFV